MQERASGSVTAVDGSNKAGLSNHFRSPVQANIGINQRADLHDTTYEDTPKVDDAKLAQQGSMEIPKIV